MTEQEAFEKAWDRYSDATAPKLAGEKWAGMKMWQAALHWYWNESLPAMIEYNEAVEEGWEEHNSVERLRYFLSLALKPQDWLDVEQFLDDLTTVQPAKLPTPSKWVLREVYFDEDGNPAMHREPAMVQQIAAALGKIDSLRSTFMSESAVKKCWEAVDSALEAWEQSK